MQCMHACIPSSPPTKSPDVKLETKFYNSIRYTQVKNLFWKKKYYIYIYLISSKWQRQEGWEDEFVKGQGKWKRGKKQPPDLDWWLVMPQRHSQPVVH